MSQELSRRYRCIEGLMESIGELMVFRGIEPLTQADGSTRQVVDIMGEDLDVAQKVMQRIDTEEPHGMHIERLWYPEEESTSGLDVSHAHHAASMEFAYGGIVKYYSIYPDFSGELYNQPTHLKVSVDIEPAIGTRNLDERMSEQDRWHSLSREQQVEEDAQQEALGFVGTDEINVLYDAVRAVSRHV